MQPALKEEYWDFYQFGFEAGKRANSDDHVSPAFLIGDWQGTPEGHTFYYGYLAAMNEKKAPAQ